MYRILCFSSHWPLSLPPFVLLLSCCPLLHHWTNNDVSTLKPSNSPVGLVSLLRFQHQKESKLEGAFLIFFWTINDKSANRPTHSIRRGFNKHREKNKTGFGYLHTTSFCALIWREKRFKNFKETFFSFFAARKKKKEYTPSLRLFVVPQSIPRGTLNTAKNKPNFYWNNTPSPPQFRAEINSTKFFKNYSIIFLSHSRKSQNKRNSNTVTIHNVTNRYRQGVAW